MLDIQLLRDNPHGVAEALQKRGFEFDVNHFLALEEERKGLQIETQSLQNERNVRSKAIGKAKQAGEDIDALKNEVSRLGETLELKKQALNEVLSQLHEMLIRMPNIPHDSTPEGKDEDDNVFLREWGTPRSFSFTP